MLHANIFVLKMILFMHHLCVIRCGMALIDHKFYKEGC